MSGILPDTTVTSARTYNAAALNYPNNHMSLEKCNCDAYVSWINSQLCDTSQSSQQKQPSLFQCQRGGPLLNAPVKDLGRDLRNGVILARLAEKLSGECLDKVHHHPVTRQQMLTNVDEILKFALKWRVKMHPVLSTEIVDGDTRATLRLVLALAAHFRPASVIRQIGGPGFASSQMPSDFSRNGAGNRVNPLTPPSGHTIFPFGKDPYPTPSPPATPASRGMTDSLSPAVNRPPQQDVFSAKLLKYKAVRSPRTGGSNSSSGYFSLSSEPISNRPPSAQFDDETEDCNHSREDSQVSSPLSHEAQAGSNGANSTCSLESNGKHNGCIEEQDLAGLQTEIASAKKTLLLLQQMLYDQDSSVGVSGVAGADSTTTDSASLNNAGITITAVAFNGSNNNGNHHQHLQKTVANSNHAPTQLLQFNESAQVLQLRAQLCEMNLTLEELAVEKRKLECRLVDRDRQLADIQASLAERDQLISHLQAKVHSLISEGRREVAELKELACVATSPVSETSSGFNSHFSSAKKHYMSNVNVNGSHHLMSSSENGDNELSSMEDGPVRINSGSFGCRIYYFNPDGAGPYCLFVAKPLEVLCLRDLRLAFNRHGRKYRYRFFSMQELERNKRYSKSSTYKLDPSTASIELRNDNDPLPGFDNQVYCSLEEIL